MKLTVWQQFSSNNSTSFTMVGYFKTREEATVAYQEIAHLLREIGEWYQKPENATQRKKLYHPNGTSDEALLPIEMEYSIKYQIYWGDPIDWIVSSDDVRTAVRQYDNLVFVQNGHPLKESFQDGAALNELLIRLKANTFSTRLGTILADVVATIPNVGVEQLIQQEIKPATSGFSIKHKMRNISISKIFIEKEQLNIIGVDLDSLPALIEYLKEKQCFELKYQIKNSG